MVLVKHAYDTEEFFEKVRKTMEEIVEGFEVREEYVERGEGGSK